MGGTTVTAKNIHPDKELSSRRIVKRGGNTVVWTSRLALATAILQFVGGAQKARLFRRENMAEDVSRGVVDSVMYPELPVWLGKPADNVEVTYVHNGADCTER